MFERASRLKLRFETQVGNLTVEDLWDLPLTSRGASLDTLAKAINKAVKESAEESFVVKKSATDTIIGLKLDIVKHVIEVKLVEAEISEKEVETKAKKERIMAIIADKEDDALKVKSADELKELLDNL